MSPKRRKFKIFCVLVLPLMAVGCASYQPKPMVPEDELLALRQTTLVELKIEHMLPGSGSESGETAFDLADGLNEPELIAIALTLNPDLRAFRMQSGEAQALLIQAGLWPNPELGLGWKSGLGKTPGTSVEADVLWELFTPWERSARKDIANGRVAEVNAAIIAEEWKLVAETRRQFLAVLFQEQSLVLLGEEESLREKTLTLVKRQKEVGDGTDLDISAAELDAAEVRRDRRHVESELALARRELNRLLGLPPQYKVPLTNSGKLPQVTVYEALTDEELERRLVAGRSDLRVIELAYKIVEDQLRLAVYRQYPHLKIGPSFTRELEGTTSFGFGLALDLPLFDQNQGEIAERESLRDQTRAAYVGLLHRLKANAYGARANLQTAGLEVEAQEKEILPLIARNRELFEKAFRARDLNILDWVTAQQRALKARQGYLETLVRYQESVIELEAATGIPLARPVDELLKK